MGDRLDGAGSRNERNAASSSTWRKEPFEHALLSSRSLARGRDDSGGNMRIAFWYSPSQ